MQKGFTGLLADIEKEQRHRLAEKIPQWSSVEGLSIPGRLALEQCSSAAAAIYKASLAPGGSVADLTSGFGVDVWAFARREQASTVYYNDINPELYNAAVSNFGLLGLKNIEFTSLSADERLNSLGRVDMVFIDPARRSGTGSKVFRLEDSSPNLLQLFPKIWEHTDTIMAKLSPMADISLISGQLPSLAEIHITGTAFECKELLCIMRKGWNRPPAVTVAILDDSNGGRTITFEKSGGLTVPIADSLRPGDLLLEPYPTLAKSGLWGDICHRFSLKQLDVSTHLFTICAEKALSDEAYCFFKAYEVSDTAPFCKASFKKYGKLYPTADVTARNVPIRSEELKKRMGISGSGGSHIFGISVNSERILAVCRQHPTTLPPARSSGAR